MVSRRSGNVLQFLRWELVFQRLMGLGALLILACSYGIPSAMAGTLGPRPAVSPVRIPSDTQIWNYHLEDRFPGAALVHPVFAVVPPGEANRLLVGQHDGKIFEFSLLDSTQVRLFADLSDRVHEESEGGLHGMTFHPNFRQNGQFFVTYLHSGKNGFQTVLYDRLSRFTVPVAARALGAVPQPEATRASEVVMIQQYDRHTDHNAGDLHFGPDGYLYVSLGDEGGQYDQFENAQRIDLNFFSGILRIDVDLRPGNLDPNPHAAVTPGTYRIPADNPWVGATSFRGQPLDPSKVRTEFFAVGLRNPWQFGFDPLTGTLYANDTGDHTREEVNRVVKGGNYGYPILEGTVTGPRPAAGEVGKDLLPPLVEYGREQGGAVTAGLLYRGTKYPEFDGAWLVSDFWQGFLGAVRFKADGTAYPVDWFAWSSGVASYALDPSTGDLLAVDFFAGRILKMVAGPDPSRAPIPSRLSELGIFSDTTQQTPNPGVVPYEVNVPFWSDGAEKQRWFALPEPTAAFYNANTGPSPWWMPSGTVFIKTLGLEMKQGDPTSRKRLETRVLVINSGHVAEGFSYRWNDAQTDAVLMPPSGTNGTYSVSTPTGITTVNWRFPSRRECFSCHHASAGGVQGFSPAQLNRDVVIDGVSVHQIDALVGAGYIATLPSVRTRIPTYAPATSTAWSLEWRTRSFLSVNCSPCHRADGIALVNWNADIRVMLESAGIVGAEPYNHLGNYQTKVIAPGEPDQSVLFRRLSQLGQGHMPPLANSVLNLTGIDLVRQWIERDAPKFQSYEDWAWTQFEATTADGFPFDRNDDPDADGYPNEYEWLAGSSPLDASPELSLNVVNTSNGVILGYFRKANRDYSVQVTSSPWDPESWTDLDDPQNAFFLAEHDEDVAIEVPRTLGNRFFRLAIHQH